jgi:hypothetical protein
MQLRRWRTHGEGKKKGATGSTEMRDGGARRIRRRMRRTRGMEAIQREEAQMTQLETF